MTNKSFQKTAVRRTAEQAITPDSRRFAAEEIEAYARCPKGGAAERVDRKVAGQRGGRA